MYDIVNKEMLNDDNAVNKLFEAIARNEETAEERTIGLDFADGLIISTVAVSDEEQKYETAIIDWAEESEAYAVERYDTLEEAKEGHLRWIEKSKTISTVYALDTEIAGIIFKGGIAKLERSDELKKIYSEDLRRANELDKR